MADARPRRRPRRLRCAGTAEEMDGRAARHVSAAAAAPRAACGRRIRRRARRTSASGRPGPGPRSRPKCARSPAGSPRRASGAACTSRSSATTGRGCTGRWPRRRRWAAFRCRCTRTRRPPSSSTCSNDAEIAYAIVEDQEQVDKLLEAQPQVPTLAHIYYDDPRGLRNYEGVTSFERLQEIGREFDRAHPGFFDAEVAQGRSRRRVDHALHVGHDRQAQGRVPDARGVHRRGARRRASSTGSTADDSILSYLPMAWVGDHLFSYAQWLVAGFTINCPESGDTVMTDLREIGPTYYFAPPRVFENLLTQVMIRMEDASALKRALFHYFTGVARRCGAEILDGKPVALARPAALRARQPARLRAAAQRARHEPHPRRLHGGRGDRPRPVPLLPLDRHQPEAALRLDRDLRLRLPAARRRRQVRHGRACRRPASR